MQTFCPSSQVQFNENDYQETNLCDQSVSEDELPGYIKNIIDDCQSIAPENFKEQKYKLENSLEKINFEPTLFDYDTDIDTPEKLLKFSNKEIINQELKNDILASINEEDEIESGAKIYKISDQSLFNIKRSFRLLSICQNNVLAYKTNIYECSICFKKIDNYGILSNCDDIFCYDCIKEWRTEALAKNKREMFKRCPICNKESPMLIKNKNFLIGEVKKIKFREVKKGNKNGNKNIK